MTVAYKCGTSTWRVTSDALPYLRVSSDATRGHVAQASTELVRRGEQTDELARSIGSGGSGRSELIDERLPAKAHRQLALQERHERAAPAGLYTLFDTYNAVFFSGKLLQAILLITDCPLRAWGDYCPADVNGLRSRIRLQPKLWTTANIRSDADWIYLGRLAADVLLHEMVHAWQYEIDGDMELGYRGHGPQFAAKCNEIGALLGLAPVSPKGRHGRPDCARWPMIVRPVDYYGDVIPREKERAEPKKKTPKKTAAAEQQGSLSQRLIDVLANIHDMSPGEYLEKLVRREALAFADEIRGVDPDLAEQLGI